MADDATTTGVCTTGKVLPAILGFLTDIPLIGPVVGAGVGLGCTKLQAIANYKKLQPMLEPVINSRGRNSQQAVDLLEMLADTAQFGACRANFRKFFIDKPDGWKDLPTDPAKISYGLWWWLGA